MRYLRRLSHHFREPVSGLSHLAGLFIGIIGAIILVLMTRDEPDKMLTMLVYGVSIILLFGSSAAMHLLRTSRNTFKWLKRLDHAAIFLMIAGNYTPFVYNLVTGRLRWGLLAAVWTLALIGAFYKLTFHDRSSHLGTLAYVGLGWMAVVAWPQFSRSLPDEGIWLIALGGAFYCVGALIYSFDKPHSRSRYVNLHDVWHMCVLGGSLSHFLVVLRFIAR